MNRSTKIIIWLVVVVLVILVFFGLNKKVQVDPMNGEEIRIGAIYAATGPLAKFGEISIQGIRDAVEYFKENTGQFAEVIVEDSAGDPKQGISAAIKLFNIDGIKFVVIGTSAVSAAVAPVAEEARSLLISDATLLGLTKDKNYTLQNFMPSLEDIPKQINDNTDWKKIGIVHINDEFGNVWQKNIVAGLSEGKLNQTFSFEKTATEYRTNAAKIKQFAPDVLVVIGYGPGLNQVLTDLAIVKVAAPVISYLSCTLPGVLTDKRFSLEGQYSYEYPPISNEILKNWIISRGREINTFYMVAFENALLALNASEKSDGDVIKATDYLKNTETPGLWGGVKFGQDGVVNRDLVLTKIQDGICLPLESKN